MSFAVASGHILTTETAEAVLHDGGSAVDACIAAAFTAFVVEPILAGPLGGGFLMVAPATGRVQCLDAFVDTPRQKARDADLDIDTITVDFGETKQDFHIGAGTIATPCLIPALFEAHDKLGRMSIGDLLAPAVQHARRGHKINAFQAHVAELVEPIIRADPGMKALFLEDDKLRSAGTDMHNADLADVFEVLAIEGPRFFTLGEVAQSLLNLEGSHLTATDLRRARPIPRDPEVITRGAHKIFLNPAPSLGGVQIALALMALPHQPDPILVARCLQAIAAIRREIGLDNHPESAHALMLDPARIATLAALLKHHKTATRGTTHISVLDRTGMGASLTLSNGEGCGRLLPGTGIHPNNMLGEEDLCPGGPLDWETGQRLASMMCPMALRRKDGQVTMLGSGGSNRIRSALMQATLNLTDFDMPLLGAVEAARLHMESGALSFEDIGGAQFREELLAEWPEATMFPDAHMFFGGVHAVTGRLGHGVDAAGDPRRAGATATSQ